MLERGKIMPPPWIALPDIERGSMHWRMGQGEWYILEKYMPWYRELSEEDKAEYHRLFPEPISWRGYFSREPECETLNVRALYVDLWRENGQPLYTREQLCKAHENGEAREYLFFWGHQPRYPGAVDKSCLSQWWQSAFVYGGRAYTCMEQCMMAGKAMAFRDGDALHKILETQDPPKIKKLGRQVQLFDEKTWNQVKYPLIVAGNYCKFSQNEQLRSFLLSTGNRVLVEASPYDCVWGIGLSADDPDSRDPHKWRGTNLLGFALMEVREEIRRVFANAELCCNPFER